MSHIDVNFEQGPHHYFKVTALYVLPGIVIGVLCEKITRYLQTKYKLNPLVAIIIQLFIISVVLYLIEFYVSPEYGSNWQSITPGLFFVSVFFGLQSSLYSNIFIVANMNN